MRNLKEKELITKLKRIISAGIIQILFLTLIVPGEAATADNFSFRHEKNNLAPAMLVDSTGFFENFLAYADKLSERKENGDLSNASLTSRRAGSGHGSFYSIRQWFVRRYTRIKNIMEFIVREDGDFEKRVQAASLMISVNIIIDSSIILPLKIAICSAALLTGNPLIIGGALAGINILGGLCRLFYYPLFKIIWPDMLSLSRTGIITNFIPWGIGNFAPILFVKGKGRPVGIQKVFEANEIMALAEHIEKTVKARTLAKDKTVRLVKKYSAQIAQEIWDKQNSLRGYGYGRFRIIGAKGCGKDKFVEIIEKQEIYDKLPLFFRGRQWLLSKLGVEPDLSPGAETPLLIFDTHQQLRQIKKELIELNLPQKQLEKIFQFDVSLFTQSMCEVEKTSKEEAVSWGRFVRPLFNLNELADLELGPEPRLLTVRGTDDCLYVKDELTKEFFESISEGAEIHVLAPGGGGDAKGAILFILQLKEMLRSQGKNGVSFKIFVPNVKYGKEYPSAGPLPIEYLEGLEPIPIEGVDKTHYYKIKPGLRAKIPVTDVNGNQIRLGEKPLYYESEWSEGKIVNLLKDENIEFILFDISQKAGELRSQYEKMIETEKRDGKQLKEFFLDMGGDCFLRIPEKLVNHQQLESTIASPVSDLSGLVIFDAPAVVMALGGDGELRNAIPPYVKEYFAQGSVSAVFDNLEFLKKHTGILRKMTVLSQEIRSEVSTNLFVRLQKGVERGWDSWINLLGPWNKSELLEKDEMLKEKGLRYEQRREFLTRLYLSSIVVGSTADIRNNVKQGQVLDQNLTWKERSRLLQEYGYMTEDTQFITYRSQIKFLYRTLLKKLETRESCVDEMLELFFWKNTPVTLKLAAVRAIYTFEVQSGSEQEFLDRGMDEVIGRELVRMMKKNDLEIFLVSEVVKTIGMIGYSQAIDDLLDFLKSPKQYGKWYFYLPYYYQYAFERARQSAERTVLALIRHEGQQKARELYAHWLEAWKVYGKDERINSEFSALKAELDLGLEQAIEERMKIIQNGSELCTDIYGSRSGVFLVGQSI